MKKSGETIFVCSNCGNEFNKWMGQCPACREWNSLKEMTGLKSRTGGPKRRTGKVEVINLGKMGKESQKIENVFGTEIGEFDRVLGKGIVRGQVILFAGEPGIGKSTLTTQLLGKIGGLYVAGEESAEQVGMRVKRLGLRGEKIDILETNDIESMILAWERAKDVYKVVVVDSIQVMATGNNPASPGSPMQIRESAFGIIEAAKRLGVAVIIVGHVTKEGEIAGPKLLEHMVDTVLYFEGDKNSDLRILRVTKNRFGPTDEIGIFKMTDSGLVDVRSDEINLVDSKTAKVGSAVTVIMEGTRPMMVEIQALVTESFGAMPKRVFSGIDYNRGQLLVAVGQKVLGMPLYKCDVFISVTGGMRVEDTGADLAVVGAMYSSFKEKALAGKRVWVGEVSLLGEVKKVRGWERRVKEAKGLGREVVTINSIRELKETI
ncbi:DNA repair protein RadA [Candidatus Shapirobacteria bacterium RBG_13_44_7]|uniref:DNA repair protein RadA n=1 Tax=Candidatus Shapirobacteria bacterium RBG_13_44_7 TaxID=1802149 RepID=A0A1F7SGI0_9BACT|nr:MAG: DNA repair protein RadA [Candidatus Shapirobacteria bacterium RBG_13_44_7]